jgi:formate hydrogenlyase subunit 3/multisubunit Na+/H+ antiporter MnhD subunit
MNTLLIWLLLPLLTGFLLLFLSNKKFLVLVIGESLVALLAIVALFVPFDDVVVFGSQSIRLVNQVDITGLQFVLSNTNRPFLIFYFAFLAFIYPGTQAARTSKHFIPISLMMTAFVISGLVVKPIIFAILFFQPAIFLGAILLAASGEKPGRGLIRFLVFQVIGMVILLMAGWSIAGGPDLTENPEALQRSLLLFGAGFTILFAIFPLHTWVTLLSEESHPFVVTLIIASFLGGYAFLLASVMSSLSWLFENGIVYEILRLAGVLMTLVGGLTAIFHKNLGRLFGSAVIIEVGYSLLTLASQDLQLFYSLLLPRIFALSVWALGLSVIRIHYPDLSSISIRGIARVFRFSSAAIILSPLSLAGVPLLAGFPLLSSVWSQTAAISPSLVLLSFSGSLGLLLGALRSFSHLVTEPENLEVQGEEDLLQRIFLTTGLVVLFLMGIFPHFINLVFIRILGGVTMHTP